MESASFFKRTWRTSTPSQPAEQGQVHLKIFTTLWHLWGGQIDGLTPNSSFVQSTVICDGTPHTVWVLSHCSYTVGEKDKSCFVFFCIVWDCFYEVAAVVITAMVVWENYDDSQLAGAFLLFVCVCCRFLCYWGIQGKEFEIVKIYVLQPLHNVFSLFGTSWKKTRVGL